MGINIEVILIRLEYEKIERKNDNVLVDVFNSHISFDLLLVSWRNNQHYHKIPMTLPNVQLTVSFFVTLLHGYII